ncbi:DnaB-like helicase N-terminal domain-containing protein [Scytonema sp. UIC 10036]|uniref:DnaB-like helicase N-terminal domain-containing protein n=1 Tax=Scytonema sp. UIC 10036 TaxID=2304196 RepID=UPI001FA9CDDF|nr:DnaB-like helicase N-terminal domain-containing protein [Scytonema sp. UIC 10036]
MTDKLPPQNIEAEESVLASCLLDSDALAKIVDILTPEKFYVSAHQQIYRAILELYRQNQPTDLLTVTSWLHDQKLLTKVGGRSQLSKLVDRKVSTVNIDHTALLILAQYQRRQLIKVGNEILELGYDVTKEIKEVLEQSMPYVATVVYIMYYITRTESPHPFFYLGIARQHFPPFPLPVLTVENYVSFESLYIVVVTTQLMPTTH